VSLMSICGFLLITLNNFCAADCPSAIADIDGDALPMALFHITEPLVSKSCNDYVTQFSFEARI
jgi:hypothetical protein